MAEFILKALVKAKGIENLYYIESAAVSDEEYGNPIYPPAKRCLTQHGVQFDSSKTARTITKADYDRFDRIICMDQSNLRWLSRIIGDDPQKKVHLMMSYTGNGRDVADPWYSGDLTDVYVFTWEGRTSLSLSKSSLSHKCLKICETDSICVILKIIFQRDRKIKLMSFQKNSAYCTIETI